MSPPQVWTGFQRMMKRLRLRIPTPILTSTFELAFAIIFIASGANLLLSFDGMRVSPTEYLPTPLALLWGSCLLLSGPLIVAGLLWRGTELMARAVEGSGLFLASAAWASYALIINTLTHGKATVSIIQAVVITLACLLRGWALYGADKAIVKANLKELGDD